MGEPIERVPREVVTGKFLFGFGFMKRRDEENRGIFGGEVRLEVRNEVEPGVIFQKGGFAAGEGRFHEGGGCGSRTHRTLARSWFSKPSP